MAGSLRGIQKFWCSLSFLCMCVLITIVFGYGDDFTASAQSILPFAGGLLVLIFLISVARSMYQNSQWNRPRSLNMNILEEFWDEMPLEILSRIVSINNHTQTYEYRNDGGEGNNCARCLVKFRDSDMVLKIESCSHVFHENCVYNWLREHMTCPACLLPVDQEPAGGFRSAD